MINDAIRPLQVLKGATARSVQSSCPTRDTFDFAEIAMAELPNSAFFNNTKPIVIIQHVTGGISIIASTALIWTILRSHTGLSTTFHRLLFGLCVADILFSTVQMLASIVIPRDLDYIFPWAHGSTATCDSAGFFHISGALSGLLYNASICIYYMTIVRYNKKDEYIRQKIEPWLHAVAIMFPLVGAITAVATKSINICVPICTLRAYKPLHCIGCSDGVIPEGFKVPCGRGSMAPLLFNIFMMPLLYGTPIVITMAMFLMYRAVAVAERKITKYGRSSLHLTRIEGTKESFSNLSCVSELLGMVKCLVPCIRKEEDITKVNRRRRVSRKKTILIRAFAYNIAYLCVYLPLIFHNLSTEFGYSNPPLALFVFHSTLLPLQGLFNFMIYMYPKVIHAKKSNNTWCQAIVKALMSRGDKRNHSSIRDSRQASRIGWDKSSRFRSISKKVQTPQNNLSRFSTIQEVVDHREVVDSQNDCLRESATTFLSHQRVNSLIIGHDVISEGELGKSVRNFMSDRQPSSLVIREQLEFSESSSNDVEVPEDRGMSRDNVDVPSKPLDTHSFNEFESNVTTKPERVVSFGDIPRNYSRDLRKTVRFK